MGAIGSLAVVWCYAPSPTWGGPPIEQLVTTSPLDLRVDIIIDDDILN